MSSDRDLNAWLAYSIAPRRLTCALRPAMWGNGRIELLADLERPCIREVICFGFGEAGLRYGVTQIAGPTEEHLLPAVYDDSGRKYFLHATSSAPADATVTFRPDRQVWAYEFDDLTVEAALILPRLRPGYLFKVSLLPRPSNRSRSWILYQELRAFQGNRLRATEASYQLGGGMVWCRASGREHGEALGATLDAEAVNLGPDGPFATDVMVRMRVERGTASQATMYLGRAFGLTPVQARETLEAMLASAPALEAETSQWWQDYLAGVVTLESPDETFAKDFLWSWADFRMNRIDVPRGRVPAGTFNSNNTRLAAEFALGAGDHMEAEAIQLLSDPEPARQSLLFLLRETRKEGLLSPGFHEGEEKPGSYAFGLGWLCGLLCKYVLTTGDFALLRADLGGTSVIGRLEDALESELGFRDPDTGLYRTGDESLRFPGEDRGAKAVGLGPNMESVTGHRGGAGTFYSDTNATVYGTLEVMADVEALLGRAERSARYRALAAELQAAIQRLLWREDIGFFCDLRPDGSVSEYRGLGGFITGLFANHVARPGGLATSGQARRLAQWCNHPDFVSEWGVLSLARSSPYFDPMDHKGFNSAFDMHWCNQVPAGLYAHGCTEEAHRQLFKLFRRLAHNAGLGPRYRGEAYNADTGEIMPWRFVNYPCILSALSAVIEGVFGLRWTADGLTVNVQSPWPWVRLRNLRMRRSVLDLEWAAEGGLSAHVDGRPVISAASGPAKLAWTLFAP